MEFPLEHADRMPDKIVPTLPPLEVVEGWGILLLCLGILLVLFFAFIYDTTVPEYPGVYNVGRMQNRQIGIWVGLGSAAGGIAMFIAGRKEPKNSPPSSDTGHSSAAGSCEKPLNSKKP